MPIDLLNELTSDRAEDPRYRVPGPSEDDAAPMVIMLPSPARARQIIEDVVTQHMPSMKDRERMASTGFHYDARGEKKTGHRYEIQRGRLEINNFIGAVPENQFALVTISRMIDPSNQSSFIAGLTNRQPNGRWVPVQVKTGEDRERRKNGTRPLDVRRAGLPTSSTHPDDEVVTFTSPKPSDLREPVEVGVPVVTYSIVWMDEANAPTMPDRDINGRPIVSGVQPVHVEADPNVGRLASVMEQMVRGAVVPPAEPAVDAATAKALKDAEIEKIRAEVRAEYAAEVLAKGPARPPAPTPPKSKGS